MMKDWKYFIFLPSLVWVLLHPSLLVPRFRNPQVFAPDKLNYMLEMRQLTAQPIYSNEFPERLYFSKLNLVGDFGFSVLNNLSPVHYFVPDRLPIELTPLVFLPFFALGVWGKLKKGDYGVFVLALFFALAGAFDGGMAFPLLIAFLYTHLALLGIEKLDRENLRKLVFVYYGFSLLILI